MKLLASVAALAALVLAATASAASFPVTKVSETAATITLGWPAQSGDGYRFYKDGVVVSRTFDPSRTSVKFSKGSTYGVEVLHVSAGDVGTYPPPVTPPPPPPGNLYISPNGNDSAACTSAAPCKSLQRAASVAKVGDTVAMAPGAYGAQSLVNVQKKVTFLSSGTATVSGQFEVRCTTGVTVGNISAKNLLVAAGNRSLVVRDSSFGGGTYTASVEDDPVVIGNVGSCSGGALSDGVVLDNVRVHDYFWQQNTGSAHTDCLQFYGGSVNVTIRNSLFERCAESFIGAYPDFGDIRNVVIEDTTFRDISTVGKGTYFASQWGQPGHSGTCSGVTIRRTTWSPGVPVPLRSECSNFLVEGNTFQTGPGQFSCDAWRASVGGVVWRGNTFLNGDGCVVG